MNQKTQDLIDQAVKDKGEADSARAGVGNQLEVVHQADEQLNVLQAAAIDAHNKALGSAHAAIEALTTELESE